MRYSHCFGGTSTRYNGCYDGSIPCCDLIVSGRLFNPWNQVLMRIQTSCIEHYLALIGACLPTLGPFFRWLRPSHWKHGNSDRPTYEDAEAFQRAWPKTHKTSNDDSIMNDSLSLTAPAGTELNSIYGMHSQSLPGQTQGNLEPGWMTSNVYGDQKNQELKNVMEVQQSEEDPKQTFRNSMELGCLRSKK